MTLLELKNKLSPLIRDYEKSGIHAVGIAKDHVCVYYKKNSSMAQETTLDWVKFVGGDQVVITECEMAKLL
jgi:hypothetical protein